MAETKTRPKSADLPPGTTLRYVGGGIGYRDVCTLTRRKTPAESHLPGWWCAEGGGLCDAVIDDPDRAQWEIVELGQFTYEIEYRRVMIVESDEPMSEAALFDHAQEQLQEHGLWNVKINDGPLRPLR